MPENKSNLVTLKVAPAVLEWVKDEQTRIRKSSGKEPTHNEVVAGLVKQIEFQRDNFTNGDRNGTREPASNTALTPGTPDEVQQVLMVLEILRSGNPDAIEGMKHGVRLFYRFIGKDPDNVVVGSARGGSGDTGAEELGGTPQATPAVGSVHRVPDKDVRTRAGRPRAAAQRGPGNK